MNADLLVVVVVGVAALIGLLMLARVSMAGFGAYRRRFTEKSEASLREAFVFIDPRHLFGLMMAGALLVPALLWLLTGSPVPPLIGLAFVIALPSLAYRRISRRRRLQIVLQMPDALTMLASSMRAGTSLQTALDIVIKETPAPLAQELGVVAREQRLGVALEDALESMARRLKLEDVDLVVAAMTIAKQVGGNLAETLDRLSGTLRAKAIMEGKIRALTSQGKLQGWIVGALPLFLGTALWFMEPTSMAPMVTTWWGLVVVGVIVVMEIIGAFFIKKIVTIDI
jgi:tight adherence protein B